MTTNEPLTLYAEASWSSPWVCSVFVALREKKCAFSTVTGMLRRGVGAVDELHDHALTGTAPVLKHGSFWLAESLAIIEYLEELVPTPRMLPNAIADRARARQIMIWMRNEHESLREERPSTWMFYSLPKQAPPLSTRATAIVADLIRVATRLGADARGALFGDTFGIVDLEIAYALTRLIVTGHDVPAPLVAYASAVRERPSVREFFEHRRPPNPPV